MTGQIIKISEKKVYNGWWNDNRMDYPFFYISDNILFFQKNNILKPDKTAQDILDQRYAKGEIDEEEYNQKSKVLKRL
jgi:hypothetical protein